MGDGARATEPKDRGQNEPRPFRTQQNLVVVMTMPMAVTVVVVAFVVGRFVDHRRLNHVECSHACPDRRSIVSRHRQRHFRGNHLCR